MIMGTKVTRPLPPRITQAGVKLVRHVGEGQLEQAFAMIDNGEVGVNENGLNECSALMMACNLGDVEAVHGLLNRGANPNSKNVDGQSCLHSTVRAKSESLKIAELLLDAGADLWAPNGRNLPAASVASALKKEDVVELFTRYASMPRCEVSPALNKATLTEGDVPMLHSPSTWHQWEQVAQVLEQKGERLSKAELLAPDAAGVVPMERAVACRAFAAVEKVLEAQGEPLQPEDMWQGKAPAGWVKRLVENQQAGQLFAPKIWQGHSAAQMGALHAALGEALQGQVPNYFQLREKLVSAAQGEEMGR